MVGNEYDDYRQAVDDYRRAYGMAFPGQHAAVSNRSLVEWNNTTDATRTTLIEFLISETNRLLDKVKPDVPVSEVVAW